MVADLEAALRSSGVEYSLDFTRAPGHAREMALTARGQPSAVLVVGGDGTVHEVATGLLSGTTPERPGPTLPPLAVLPVGTGNDFCRMVRGAGSVGGAVRTLREGVARPFEVGFVRWDGGQAHFVNLVGVGIDVEVLKRRASFTALRGLPQYLAALGSALLRYRPVRLGVTSSSSSGPAASMEPADSMEGEVLLAAVTVGPSIGGGFLLSPAARPDDGLLDLFVAENMGMVQVLRSLPGILRGTDEPTEGVHRRQVSGIELRRLDGEPLFFELDGEIMAEGTTVLDVRIQVGSLRVLELPEGRPQGREDA